MITINCGNSYSQITGLSPAQEKEVRKLLSYSNGDHFSRFGPKTIYLIDKKGFFPTGLLHRVETWLDASILPWNFCFPKIKSQKFVDHDPKISRVPYTAQSNALGAASISGRGTLSLPTGSGKSLVIALLIAKFSLRTLIIVPNLELKRQLTADLQSQFSMANITIENIDSKALAKATNYDLLIIDEAHHTAARTYQNLNKKAWTNISKRFFLTATPFRNQKEETLLFEAIAGRVIYELSYKQAVAEGYIVPVEAFYVDLPKVETYGYNYAEIYNERVVSNKPRNDLIALILLRLNANKKSTLCLVKEIAHGNILRDKTNIPFANGQDEDSRQDIQDFSQGKLTSMIGTTGMVGEGVDTLPCEYVVIAGLGKAKSAFLQQVGRAVRKYKGKETAKVIIFRDPSHRFTLNHYREQVKILKDYYGVVPTKIEI